MRILFLSHYFPPEGNAPASRTHENCKRWRSAGHEVTVITCAPNCPNGVLYPGYRNRLRQREFIDGIEVIRVWSYLAPNKGTARRILNYLSFMLSATFFALSLKKPDIIIATSPQFFCGWAGVLVSKLRRVPFILEVRDLWPDAIIAVGALTNGRIIRLLGKMELLMYRAATHIVTVGHGYKREIVQKGITPHHISVFTNGADLDVFHPIPRDENLAAALGIRGKFVCSYSGTVGMASGLDIVLRAASILRDKGRNDIVVLLIGDGAVRQTLEAEAHRLGLGNVMFIGRRSKEDMPRLLSVSDVCLVHLRKHRLFLTTLPSKIFEALAMAKPIILGVEGCAARIVQKARGGICIEPENENQLVAALERLADNPELVQELGQAGCDCIRRHYNRDELAKGYLNTIETVARAGPRKELLWEALNADESASGSTRREAETQEDEARIP